MGLQENSSVVVRSKSNYSRVQFESGEEDNASSSNTHQNQEDVMKKNHAKKYAIVCTMFVSLTSVLMGYGQFCCFPL